MRNEGKERMHMKFDMFQTVYILFFLILIKVSMPLTSFSQALKPAETIATDGYCSHAIHAMQEGPVFGNGKLTLSYMNNSGTKVCHSGGDAGAHRIYVKQYDYASKQWSTSAALASVNPTCCDGHDTPVVHRDPNGYLDVIYGPIAAGSSFSLACGLRRNYGPFYRRSTRPDDITSWGPEKRIPICGAFSENSGGYTANAYLHLFGQKQWGTSDIPSYDLVYIKRSPDLIWSKGVALIRDNGKDNAAGGGKVGPGCMHAEKIVGNTIHLVWSSTTNGCSGSGKNLYYAVSHDNGETWYSANRKASFQRTSGLVATSALTYPSAYLVRGGSTTSNITVDVLSDGTVLIANQVGGALNFYKWAQNAWQTQTIAASGLRAPIGMTMGVTSADEIVVITGDARDVWQYRSTDSGATWHKSLLHQKGREANNRNFLGTMIRLPGQDQRLVVEWLQTFGSSAARPEFRTELVFSEIVFPGTRLPQDTDASLPLQKPINFHALTQP